MLKLENLAIGYRSRRREAVISKDIDLESTGGEFICLLGPNGAGKSTLLRTIAGMQASLEGRVLIDGVEISRCTAQQRAKLVSVVLTERTMAGLLTGYVMVSLGRYPHTGWFGDLSWNDNAIVEDSLRLAGAEAFGHRLVGELSDGERQRVMLARALAQQPKLLILDEITAFLDLPRRVEVMELLRGLALDTGRTVLISTHDLDLALRNADRLLLLGSDGTLYDGAPEDLVLNGAFSQAFSSEGIDFDLVRGAFQIKREGLVSIALSGGAPIRREWTRRAVERNGFEVREVAAIIPDSGAVIDLSDSSGWTLREGRSSSFHKSIYQLGIHLRHLLRERSVE